MIKKRMTSLGEFLTIEQIKTAIKCKGAKEICEKVIAPNINVINTKLGQVNDPMFLAYMVEYAISQSQKHH